MPVQSTISPHTILLRGMYTKTHRNAKADAALKPGHIITKNATDEVLKHATAGAGGQIMVAMEDRLIGRTINDAYAEAESVPYHIPTTGDWLYLRVAAAASAIVHNAPLTSDGAGCVKLATGDDIIIARALEALDNSAGGSEAFLRTEWAEQP